MSQHPNARERKTYPPLPSDVTVGVLRQILSRHDDADRVPYFKVKVVKHYGVSQHESTHPDHL